jgi:hypothetical protein
MQAPLASQRSSAVQLFASLHDVPAAASVTVHVEVPLHCLVTQGPDWHEIAVPQ